jgi:hypothetical protein
MSLKPLLELLASEAEASAPKRKTGSYRRM